MNNSNSNSSCSVDNYELQNIFMSVSTGIVNMSVYDPESNPPWVEGFEPTCVFGIPGITSTKTFVGM